VIGEYSIIAAILNYIKTNKKSFETSESLVSAVSYYPWNWTPRSLFIL